LAVRLTGHLTGYLTGRSVFLQVLLNTQEGFTLDEEGIWTWLAKTVRRDDALRRLCRLRAVQIAG
jgi:hypothetical protein